VETNPSATTGLHGGLAPQVPAPNNKHPPKTYLGHSSNKQIFKLFFVCSGFLHRPGENAVNVKLTMRFRIAAGLLWSAHSISRGFLQARRDGYTGGVKQIWSSRGEGWGCHPGPPRERSAQIKEGFLRALLFLWPFGLFGGWAFAVAPGSAATAFMTRISMTGENAN